ncbi:kelch-like protein 17 [Lingula anatina]|uniref:Kelch-like protein 17 n=1 Tax=Lingula anatina TaxID=7574 RepID=A0A1S3HQX7_LINAN|nr:kelch-like protein 17 [Lingula anatina]XP_013388459.2 kelch-like protein 17 [Lingula anatina]|eukprot:XP_013388458.2 kelch-like protein 17 [Lingula anatina]
MIDSRLFGIHLHMVNAFQTMDELRKKCELCDIVLLIEKHEFHAHKIVLAGSSPYLRAMFTNGMLETEKNQVEIHGIDPAAMRILLDFMYTGKIEITVDNVQAVLHAASMLNIGSVRSVCSNFLQTQLDATNCLGIYHLADTYSSSDLLTISWNYIAQHFLDLSHTDEFLQLPEGQLLNLLKSDQLQVTCEEDVADATIRWIEWDPYARAENACQILPYVRLALLDLNYLENVVLQCDFVRNCAKCQSIVAQAVKIKNESGMLGRIASRAQPQSIYVLGGRNSTDCQLKSVEKYDFVQDQWTQMGNMTVARTAVGATTVNGLLYAVGGECALAETQDDTLYLRCVECYSPISKCWTSKADMKIPRSFVAVVSCGEYLYAIGGEDRGSSFNIVERYNTKTDTWHFVPNMQRRRAGAGVAVCDGVIYVAGGYDKAYHTDRASVECFDPETNQWTFVAEMEKARSGMALVAIDHYLYAFGGRLRFSDQYYDIAER